MQRLSYYAKAGIPFAFVISYDKSEVIVEPLDALDKIAFERSSLSSTKSQPLDFTPVSYTRYEKAFNEVIEQIKGGNTYLMNLTFPSQLHTEVSLAEIFGLAKARYKVWLRDRFVSFSPESFIRIDKDTIATYPMKGTIKAAQRDARRKLLDDPKELAEHTMIVDLLRNDLGIRAHKVRVKRFRYLEQVGDLLQASSEIKAQMPDWKENLGEIFDAMLPAGSITGTPKKSCCDIIKRVEGYDRGFFTGVFGVYDGKSLDSCVLIRYIERQKRGLVYKSGGGITLDSQCAKEYAEMCDKVYLPL